MNIDEKRIFDRVLTSTEACLGAVFCSYTFEPAYFEEQVLRVLLKLRSDPDEEAVAYHEEARRLLIETPVACFVDASVRRPGRRLPYDAHLVRARTFHPKVTLVLFESEARLAVGSGNVTKAGLEGNTELFFFRALPYVDVAAAALLRDVLGFFEACAALAEGEATQLALVRQALVDRLPPAPEVRDARGEDVQLVHTFTGRLLDRLDEALPGKTTIVRVGVLAPFFEQDDLAASDTEDGMNAVLAQLLALRPSKGAVLDVGVPWGNAPIAAPPASAAPRLEDGVGGLWAWRRSADDDGGAARVDYLVVTAVTEKSVRTRDAGGNDRRLERPRCEADIAAGNLWRVPRPLVHAPRAILSRLAATRDVQLWLHPAASLSAGGRPRRRPLHAKVFLVATQTRGVLHTFVLMGSANASKMALDKSVDQGGNVEAGILCRLDGEVGLRDVLPSLFRHELAEVDLVEREMSAAPADLSACIDEIVHDAAARTLTIQWVSPPPFALGDWSARYVEKELLIGNGNPTDDTQAADFDLLPASAELTFVSGGGEWSVPIRVLDLAHLPSNALLGALGLRELLALLGRRLGVERLAAIEAQRGPAGLSTVLDAVFGDGLNPTDIFKAWWGAADDLRRAVTVGAFRGRLVGPLGVCTAWEHLRVLPEAQLSRDEVWIYGCELLRELSQITLPDTPDAATRAQLLTEVTDRLRGDLATLAPPHEGRAWLEAVSSFYGVGESHV